jgi:hypothetical protein
MLQRTRSGERSKWNANQNRIDNILKNKGDEYGTGQGTTPTDLTHIKKITKILFSQRLWDHE